MRIEAELLVGLKGADLAATTAWLTLIGPMNQGEHLLGLAKFDLYRFSIDTTSDPDKTVIDLEAVLNAQSTFFNRNKHFHSLDCRWEGGAHREGYARTDIRERWESGLANSLQDKTDRDFCGKDSSEPPILVASQAFRVEVTVQDDDQSARDALAAKLQASLQDKSGAGATTVACQMMATLWWLALVAPDADTAREMAEKIAVTRRRDEGLLSNPNFQRAEIVSIDEIMRVSI